MNRWSLCIAAAAFVAIASQTHAQPPVFRAGAATSNITPPLGSDIVGGFAPFPATHVHDELHADRKSTRLNSSHIQKSRMPSSA